MFRVEWQVEEQWAEQSCGEKFLLKLCWNSALYYTTLWISCGLQALNIYTNLCILYIFLFSHWVLMKLSFAFLQELHPKRVWSLYTELSMAQCQCWSVSSTPPPSSNSTRSEFYKNTSLSTIKWTNGPCCLRWDSVNPQTATWTLKHEEMTEVNHSSCLCFWFRSWRISSSCVQLGGPLALRWVWAEPCGCTYLTTPLRITKYGQGWLSVTITSVMGRSFRSCSTRLLRRTSASRFRRVT